jgi:hypothetical protein
MTPLAQRLMRRSLLPVNDRFAFDDPNNLLDHLEDFHCFEISQIAPMWEPLAKMLKPGQALQLVLPAPFTWLEYVEKQDDGNDMRVAIAVVEHPANEDFAAVFITFHGASTISHVGSISLVRACQGAVEAWRGDAQTEFFTTALFVTQLALVCINSPKVICRNAHAAHRGLCRDIAHTRACTGKATLHDWHEIILKINTGEGTANGRAGYATGKRALHFCRSHLRIQCGKLVHVRSHWRGDASIGVRHATYSVRP